MSASVARKKKQNKEPRLATTMFKKGTFTSQWTEEDAISYFNMNKSGASVFRTGPGDTNPVEWYTNDKREVLKKDIA